MYVLTCREFTNGTCTDQAWDYHESFLSSFTVSDAATIAMACVGLMVTMWAFKQLRKLAN